MAGKDSLGSPAAILRARLFGDFTELSNAEIDSIYKALYPDAQPLKNVSSLSAAAMSRYVSGNAAPRHVRACRKQCAAAGAKKIAAPEASHSTARVAVNRGRSADGKATDGAVRQASDGSLDEPRRGLAAILADALLDTCRFSSRTDLDRLCRKLGLQIHEKRFPHFDGILALHRETGLPGARRYGGAISEEWERFMIAHEIGHLMIPRRRKGDIFCDHFSIGSFSSELSAAEREANEFATELLLPRRKVRTRLNLERPSLDEIDAVAREFGTSLTAAASCFISLTREPCAMIASRRDRVIWRHSSGSMPNFPTLKEIPGTFRRHRISSGRRTASKMVEVSPKLWFGDHPTRLTRLFQESIALDEPETALTLLWAPVEKRPKDLSESRKSRERTATS
jgi:hypothetical protein